MRRFAFVESNTTGTGGIAVRRLLSRGDSVTFITRNAALYPFLAGSSPGLSVVSLETNDGEQVSRALAAGRQDFDAVVTFSDFYVDIVAEATARAGLRYLGAAPARTCRHKASTRTALAAAGLPVPRFRLVRGAEEALEFAAATGFPLVVKPPADSSSYGVRIVATAAELLAQVHALGSERTNVRGQLLDGTVLLESLLAGPEFSVETMTLARGETRILGITEKYLSPPPHCVETGHDFPAAIAEGTAAALRAAVLAGLAAVGFDFGPAHTEIRLTAGGPAIIEINPRLAGGMIPELVRLATGVDPLEAFLDLLAGGAPLLAPDRDDVAAIRFLLADRRGYLCGVHGLAAARAVPSVREVHVGKPVGAAVQPPENAYHRLGHVLAAAADRGALHRDLAAAMAHLRYDIAAAAPAEPGAPVPAPGRQPV